MKVPIQQNLDSESVYQHSPPANLLPVELDVWTEITGTIPALTRTERGIICGACVLVAKHKAGDGLKGKEYKRMISLLDLVRAIRDRKREKEGLLNEVW